jgi:hypothetical protein
MRKSIQIPGLQPNSRYVVQLRGVDADGNPGPWSTQFEFPSVVDLMPPAQVQNLSVAPIGASFAISWDAVTTNADGSAIEDLRDYVITIVADSLTRVFNTTNNTFNFSFTLNKQQFVTPRPQVSVTVQARDRVGNLSGATTQSASNSAPGTPILTAAAKRNGVELVWTDTFDDDGKRFEIWKNGFKYADVSAGTLTWTDTDVGSGAQTYFVRAFDLFEQSADSNSRVEGEISLDINTDTIAPKPPTNLQAVDNVGQDGTVTLSWAAPTEDTDNTSYTDQEGFEVRYRTGVSRPWTYRRVPDLRADGSVAETFSMEAQNIPPGVTLSWEVRAFDRSLNYSTWAISSIGIAEDTTPPAAPTGLTLSGGIRTIIASWTPNTEDDLAGYRLYASTSPSVQINSNNLRFEGLGTTASLSAGDGETWYARVVAYDIAGNVSAASSEQSATSLSALSDTDPPTNVTGLQLSKQFYYHGATEFARINASWSAASDESGIFGYVVAWQRFTGDVLGEEWTENVVSGRTRYTLTGIDVVDEEAGEDDTESLLSPAQYAFRVKAIDNNGNLSENWSATQTITLDIDGEAPSGGIRREVAITADGAIQSVNFVNLLRGFRLSDESLEIYGSEDHDVSILLGSGGQGLNLSTINSQLWFGSANFSNATWRVGEFGDMRVGGPGADAEKASTIADYLSLTNGPGSYKVFFETSPPTAQSIGDLWAGSSDVYIWNGSAWVEVNDAPLLSVSISRLILSIVGTEGSLLFTVGTEPNTPSENDFWLKEELEGVTLYQYKNNSWADIIDPGGSFYASAEGDIWSGSENPLEAPWLITRHGRATFGNIKIEPNELMPDESDLLYISDVNNTPLLAIHKIADSDWEFRLGMNMFIDATGNLELNGGSINLRSGNVTLNGGDFEMFSGNFRLTGAPVTLEGSELRVIEGNIVIDGGTANNPEPTGIIQSADYDYAARTGWALDQGNLYLFSGEIDASLITIRNTQNLLEYGYTTMPYKEAWYAVNVQEQGLVASLTNLWSRYGARGLRLQGGAGSTAGFYEIVDGQEDFSKVRVEPGLSYIFSVYVYNNTLESKDVQLFVVQQTGESEESGVFTIPAGISERIHFMFDVEPGVNGLYTGMRILSDLSDFIVDGMQLELRTISDEPSPFNIGGSTIIDGGAIQTGSITSNNYLEGQSGWKIGMNGDVEFQGGVFRGQLFAEDFVSGTITNQNLLLGMTERFVSQPYFEEQWVGFEILKRSLAE